MKRANEILNKVKRRPQFKSIQKYSCYNKLLTLLPPRFQKAIAFIYIKGNTLFGGLSHPGFKNELNYNKDLVKDLLNQISNIEIECKEIFGCVENIEFFVSRNHAPPPIKPSTTDLKYRELAKGEFKILAKDSDITNLFIKIKEDVVNNAQN